MFCIPKYLFILCTITSVKAIGLRIDGLLNLGDNWNYEYRILRSDAANGDTHQRAEEDTDDKNFEDEYFQNDEPDKNVEAANLQKDDEEIPPADFQAIFKEEREIAYKKNEDKARAIDKMIARQKEEEKIQSQIESARDHLRLVEDKFRNNVKRLRKEAENPKLDQRLGPDKYKMHYIHNNKIAKTDITTAATERSNNATVDVKIGTAIIYEEATKKTTKKIKTTTVREVKKEYKDTRYSSESRSSESRDFSETFATVKNKTKDVKGPHAHVSTSKVNIMNKDNYTTQAPVKKIEVPVNKSIHYENKTRTPPTSTKVTTVRTKEIFTEPHTVGNDSRVIEFIEHLFNHSLKIFSKIREKTDQDHVKAQINDLAASYHKKFKEFIKDTKGQMIKTRLGTQKVILNTIDTSNRLLRRLLNFLINNMDKKGSLRHNARITNKLEKAIELEQKVQSLRACKRFGICRMGSGLSEFIIKILSILLKCDDAKFKQSIDAFTEVAKSTDYNGILESHIEKKLKILIGYLEKASIFMVRAMVMILKNTLMSQNKPMIVSNHTARSNVVNSTLIFLEIVDLLDTEVPKTEANQKDWNDMTNSLEQFANGKRKDIQAIMEVIFNHFTKNLKSLVEGRGMVPVFILCILLQTAAGALMYGYRRDSDDQPDLISDSKQSTQQKYDQLLSHLRSLFKERPDDNASSKSEDYNDFNPINNSGDKQHFDDLISEVTSALDNIKKELIKFNNDGILTLETPTIKPERRFKRDLSKTNLTVINTTTTSENDSVAANATEKPEPVTEKVKLLRDNNVTVKMEVLRVKNETDTNISGRRMMQFPSPPKYVTTTSRVKDKLLSYLEDTFNEVERKIKPLTNIKIALSNDDHYRIGYIIATIDTLEVNLKKLKNDMNLHQNVWDDEKILDLFDRIKATNTVTTSLIETLKQYLPRN
ncbi:hypothetical protein PYW08_012164 [Mythimna loreyi]|uniref:Uncharacterized protein n=1 Tax=Mythimna loreyi TaxID=667449 RepID=A0ACC2PZW2_9NEOP|nr:hypothetical protein PYW08_012164 [Mythimna loreyi]